MRLIATFLFIYLSFFNCYTQNDNFNCLIIDERGKIREHNVDFQKLVLDVKFNTTENSITGFANYTFKPLRTSVNSLFLDAPNIEIESIKLSGQNIDFDYIDKGINLKFNNPLTWDKSYHLLIKYKARPQKGMYFIGWNDKTNRSRKQIWTQGQGIDNRHWIPSYDGVNDKLITETIITFDSEYEVISNGILKSKTKNKNNSTTWHYAMNKPHSIYLMMIAIGKYSHRDYVSNSGVISRQYYYSDKPDAENTTYQYSNKMMNWFESELGVPYQWEIYKNVPVQDFMYGAMENTSATIYTDYYLQTKKESLERNYVGTNAHELAHQWFGDYVTEWSGSSHWLHESFATHYSKQFLRTIYGEDYYRWACRNEQNAILKASEKNNYPIAYTNSGSSRHYSKGSFVLDMLRNVVGNEEYKKTVNNYLRNHSLDMVDTHDFQKAFLKTLGMNLDWFFNQWILKGGEPEYEVTYKAKFNKTVFNVKQIQEKNDLVGLFRMPIVFQVYYKDGSYDEYTEWIEDEEQEVAVLNKQFKKIDYVLFDPNSKVLKKVIFKKTFKELISQAQNAKNMIDRYDAVKAMDKVSIGQKRDVLIDIYLEEDFKAIKLNILKQLKEDESSKTEQLYVYAIGEKDAEVRRRAIKNLTIRSKRYIKFYEEMLNDESYVNAELALNKLCKRYPDMQHEYLNRTRHLTKENIKYKLNWKRLSFGSQKKLFSEISDYASESFDFRVRLKAIDILGEIAYYDEAYMKNLVNAYLHLNRRLKRKASKQLDFFLESTETSSLVANYINNHKWFPFQEKQLNILLEKHGKRVFK